MPSEKKPQSYAATMKGGQGVRRIIKALGYSADGIRSACEEQGFRQLLWIHAVLLIGIVVLDFTLPVRMILLLASLFSIVVELINTGLEAAVDHTSEEMHVLAKKAKDVGSAAQYLTLAGVIVLWIMALVG
ncbi:diacylglycerol kinase [Neisseria montereyensis]|uniref:Diacylglycerol kinase n=1 Tax=Neisseria montereyensis TaxID=2973938 RepID=A0ABT2FB04_9NEIS|nr:diacylglycerol kinase [Neisseria montereyensis]MCS4533351.1 diacylglycerol kinase [Neisseria montereyensis]